MNLTVFEKGFNFSEDGPGNRLVLHLQGCNLRCPWCANPEGIPVEPPLMQLLKPLPDWACPRGAVKDGALDRSACRGCARRECVSVNRNRALCVKAVTKPVPDWFAEVLSAEPMFFSGGGLTLTGGEVCVQIDAALALLRLCRAQGIHTAVETNLAMGRANELFPALDLLIADYKHHDAGTLKSVTGADLATVERNFCLALERGLPTILRIPLISGFNAGEPDMEGFAKALKRMAGRDANDCLSVELLSYHEYGKEKWAQCGLEYKMANGHVEPGLRAALAARLRADGLTVIST